MESFSSPPLKNVLDRRRWHTRVELRRAIVVLIENLHHRSRRQDEQYSRPVDEDL